MDASDISKALDALKDKHSEAKLAAAVLFTLKNIQNIFNHPHQQACRVIESSNRELQRLLTLSGFDDFLLSVGYVKETNGYVIPASRQSYLHLQEADKILKAFKKNRAAAIEAKQQDEAESKVVDEINTAIAGLETSCHDPADYSFALWVVHHHVSKILDNPGDSKLRTISTLDAQYFNDLGQFAGSGPLMSSLGFHQNRSNPSILTVKATNETWDVLQKGKKALSIALRASQSKMTSFAKSRITAKQSLYTGKKVKSRTGKRSGVGVRLNFNDGPLRQPCGPRGG